MCYNRRNLALEHQKLIENLENEQKMVYIKLLTVVNKNKDEFFFLYNFGETGKTFIWKTLSASIRSKGEIVLTVASSKIKSLLLPGGRKTHSWFDIQINITKDSTYNIKKGTPLPNLIVKSKLIIWDKTPMMHRNILSFKDLANSHKPFGGKTVVFRGASNL